MVTKLWWTRLFDDDPVHYPSVCAWCMTRHLSCWWRVYNNLYTWIRGTIWVYSMFVPCQTTSSDVLSYYALRNLLIAEWAEHLPPKLYHELVCPPIHLPRVVFILWPYPRLYMHCLLPSHRATSTVWSTAVLGQVWLHLCQSIFGETLLRMRGGLLLVSQCKHFQSLNLDSV